MESRILEIITHALLSFYCGYTIWSAQPGTSLFSWHPTCMILAQFLFAEGVILFKGPSPKWRITVHWICQGIAFVLLSAGFSIIYLNKELNEKPHFKSWHGLAGLVTLTIMTTQIVIGTLAKMSVKLKFISSKALRLVHRGYGLFSILASLTTVLLVFRNATDQIVYILAVIIPVVVSAFSRVNYGFSKKQLKN